MGKVAGIITLFLGFPLLFSPQELKAEMFMCVDATGKTQYTNMNNSPNCRSLREDVGINGRPGSAESFWSGATLRNSMQRKASSYDRHISQSSYRYNVDPYLIKAVIKTESNFDCFALSKKGAQGLMQLMPATAKEMEVRNPFNPYENIDGGTRYLRDMLKLFNGDIRLSLAAYNAGPTRVRRLQKVPKIPETVKYVNKVLAYYKAYRGSLPEPKTRVAVGKLVVK